MVTEDLTVFGPELHLIKEASPEKRHTNSIYSFRDNEALTLLRTNSHPQMVNISKIF